MHMYDHSGERAKCLELFDFVRHVCCVSWWRLDLLKVKIDNCVRYNRIFVYCVPSKHPLNTAYQKGGVTLKYTQNTPFTLGRIELHALTEDILEFYQWNINGLSKKTYQFCFNVKVKEKIKQ